MSSIPTGANPEPVVPTAAAFRQLLVFQVKLALDALRDLALSPLSVMVFLLDVILKPAPEQSLYARLMRLGQRSDRAINLFNEYSDQDCFTVDQAINDVQQAVQRPGRQDPDE